MAQSAAMLATEPIPDGWLPLAEAAERLGQSERHLRRRCSDELQRIGLAKQCGRAWIVSKTVDPRLADARIETAELRDIRQVGELAKEGYAAAAIRLAERKRDIVAGLCNFKGRSRGEESLRREFINSLYAAGKLPVKGIPKLSVRGLRKWQADYRVGGIRALVRKPYSDRECRAFGTKARDLFANYMLTVPGQSAAEALRLVIGHVRANGWGEDPDWAVPSVRHAQQWYAENIPHAVKVHAKEGPHKFAAKCLPKIARCLEEVPAGSHLVGDERTMDFMVRVPSRDGWRRARPKLTAWMDSRSRMIAGWILSESANSGSILASFKMACLALETAPDEVTIDNGKDYRSVAGRTRRSRKWDEFDAKLISSAFERLGVTVHYAIVRQPWAKSIESRFNTVKDGFDRYFESFWGGTPDERPWDADRWTREHIERLPTMEEARDAVDEFLAALHEEPLNGDGMFGLSPRQAMKQYYTQSPRPVSAEALTLICTRMHGPVKVGRDGVRFNNTLYGKFDDEIVRLQGQRVYLLADPVEAFRVTICDERGVPITTAYADKNLGQTVDEVRAAEAARRRAKRIVKAYPQARDTTLRTPMQGIAELRTIAAKARQIPDEQLPPPPERVSARIVRPDIERRAQEMKKAAGVETLRRLHKTDAAASALNETRAITLSELNAISAPVEPDEPPARSVTLYELTKLSEANRNAP